MRRRGVWERKVSNHFPDGLEREEVVVGIVVNKDEGQEQRSGVAADVCVEAGRGPRPFPAINWQRHAAGEDRWGSHGDGGGDAEGSGRLLHNLGQSEAVKGPEGDLGLQGSDRGVGHVHVDAGHGGRGAGAVNSNPRLLEGGVRRHVPVARHGAQHVSIAVDFPAALRQLSVDGQLWVAVTFCVVETNEEVNFGRAGSEEVAEIGRVLSHDLAVCSSRPMA